MALVTIAPVLNFMPMMSLMVAPFRAALTGLAVCGLLGWFIAQCIATSPRPMKAVFGLAFAVYAFACGALVFRSVQDWSSGVRVSETIVKSNELSVFAWLELGRSLINENRFADAKAVLDKVAYNGVAPGEPRVARPVKMGEYDDFMAHLFVQASYGLYNLGDQAAAREALQAGGELAPQDLMVYLGKADLAYSDGDWKQSVEFLRIALAADPDMTERRLARARILLGHGLHSEAKAEFEECLRRQPNMEAAKTGLAFAKYLVEHPPNPKK
jgi:tetratricopeptide (TPR) repeat protein